MPKLRQLCPHLDYLDVGGGLGIDYDGSRTASESSVNYSVEEYANDIIYSIKEVCDSEDVREPNCDHGKRAHAGGSAFRLGF